MGKDGSCHEGYFEGIEGMLTLLGKVPRGILSGEPSKGDVTTVTILTPVHPIPTYLCHS